MRQSGFTLIELMITVAIVAILASIALPAYTDYIRRGQIAEGTQLLQEAKVGMEQYYANNRTYVGAQVRGVAICGAPITSERGLFTVTAAGCSATGFTLTATGQGAVAGFAYTINEANLKGNAITATGWASSATGCWVNKKGGVC